jgi:hypothetical protein
MPPSETQTEEEVEEAQVMSAQSRGEVSEKSTPVKEDWETNMMYNNHFRQVYAIANERTTYQLEYFKCSETEYKHLKAP